MGITIHYYGKLKSPELIDEICSELKEMAQSMDWSYKILDGDFDKPNSSKLEVKEELTEITGNVPLKGVQLMIHKECASFDLFFDANGILREFIQMVEPDEGKEDLSHFVSIKTQYAPIDAHITIIELLKFLKEKYFHDLEVQDEGEYWETENKAILIEKMEFLSDKIESFSKTLNELKKDEFNNCDSDLAIAAKLEEILKTKLTDEPDFSKTKSKYIH